MEDNNKMMIEPLEGKIVSTTTLGLNDPELIEDAEIIEDETDENHPIFIDSNTNAISIAELSKEIVPTFADNQVSISHLNFIKAVRSAAEKVFGELTPVEIRVSHPIIGRTPDAIHLKASELREDQKTCFSQRLAWICHVKGLTREIDGKTVELTIGGCRSYHEDKLYNRLSPMHFRIMVSWSMRICSNQIICGRGNSGLFDALTEADIFQKAIELFSGFDPYKEENLQLLQNLTTTTITEEQFCKIMGRLRLYQALPTSEQKLLPNVSCIGDQACNKAIQNYVQNTNGFGRKDGEELNIFNMLNLLNEAVKSKYIDRWMDSNQACTDFAIGIQKALNGEDTEGYDWFLN